MRTHYLKIWPEFWPAIKSGKKPFEVRRDDWGFAVGDVLVLKEYDPAALGGAGKYTGKEVNRRITYKLPGGKFGIDPNYCVLGLSEIPDS